ncbi:MAG: dUTP diphosphatase [Streptococcus sp.]|jgi:deoxyUTP pyrophosphatase|nr:MAG: dUTP diphosphatase [Streptococcus sp.]
MRKRGFEIVSKFKNEDINLPVRKTNASAGYDFEAAESLIVPSIWKILAEKVFVGEATGLKATLIPTGIKSYMLDDEYLQLSIRSGTALKTGLILANGVGIVDSDYYNNPDNEGHIMFPVHNLGFRDKLIKKGERIGQGLFLKYLKADGDTSDGIRTGGFGSTDKEK